jgi:hypothetical protein
MPEIPSLIKPMAEWLSMISSIFTIMGITGLLGWGLRNRTMFGSIISVLRFFIRLSISLIFMPIIIFPVLYLSLLFQEAILSVILAFTRGSYPSGIADTSATISITISLFIGLIVYILLTACIFTDSLEPIRKSLPFWQSFQQWRKDRKTQSANVHPPTPPTT